MICSKCGNYTEGEPAFCPKCGAPNQGQQTGYGAPQGGYGAPQGGYGAPQGSYYSGQPGGYPPTPTNFRVPIANRNIALCIILSIVTCGIYGLYWLVCMVNDLNVACNAPNETTGGTVLLLSIVTCGIYLFYWMYKAGGQVAYIKQCRTGYSDSNTGLVYLLLSIFGLSIVSYALIQNELNQVSGI